MPYTIYRQGQIGTLYDMPLFVNWSLTQMCNYHCSYCFDSEKRAQGKVDKRFSSIKQIDTALNHIASANRPQYRFTLAGGEPTIHPHFMHIINTSSKLLGKRLIGILVISNGSRSGDLYENLASVADKVNLSMLISIHTEFAKPDHIIDLVKILANRIELGFHIMFHPGNKDVVVDFVKLFLELRKLYLFDCEVTLLREPPTFSTLDKRYTKEDFLWQEEINTKLNIISECSPYQMKRKSDINSTIYHDVCFNGEPNVTSDVKGRHFIVDEEFSVGQREKLNFKNMYCITGAHVLRIEYDGSVRGAVCSETKKIGNIYVDNPYQNDEFIKAVRCTLPACRCRSNIMLPKFLDQKEADLFTQICRQKQRSLLKM